MFRRPLLLAALIAVSLAFGACADAPTGPSNKPSFSADSASKCQGTQGAHDCRQ